VTLPTGIRAIARLGGLDVVAKIWDVIEAKRGVRQPVPVAFLRLPRRSRA
jgi:glutathione synthase